jgi:surfeit locus 1 family protein
VIDDLLKNETFLRWFPLFAGLVFIALFLSLGKWQLNRAAEKEALLEVFKTDEGFVEPTDWTVLADFDRIKVFGQFLEDRQVLIDNIPRDGRLGYYVVTPFAPATTDELLLVNRGWLPKPADPDEEADLSIDGEFRTILGFAGHLPRVAIRPGEAFVEHRDWPRVALYPSNEEVATELGKQVLPSVLLLHPGAEDGFVRRWEPDISGPITHYSYAFQWFALAVAVAGIASWQLRKRFLGERA